MRFLRALLVLSLVVGLGAAFAAALPHAGANPACAQDMPDHDRDCGTGSLAASCSPAGCTHPAVTVAPGIASLERLDVGSLPVYAATPLSSLALPPETAPPKHPIV